MGVVVGRYIDFLILLIPTPLVSALLFVHLKKCFSFSFQYIFVIYLIIFSHSINKHKGDFGHPTEAV